MQEVRVDDLLFLSNCSIMILGCVLVLQKKGMHLTLHNGRCVSIEENKSIKCVYYDSHVAKDLL